MPFITTGIGRIARSHFGHLNEQVEGPTPLRAPPYPELTRRDLLGGLIHEYDYAA
jgi:hypothetical protein